MKKLNSKRKTMLDRQAKKKGLKRSTRKVLLANRKKQSGSVSQSAIQRSSLMKRILKENAQRAKTRSSGATARAKERPTFLSKVKNKLWNRKTG